VELQQVSSSRAQLPAEPSGGWIEPAGSDPDAEDAVLVAAARADRQAFRPLYERYVRQVHGYCYLRLGSREAAEDATSEVFLNALAGLEGYRGGVFAGWLFRIAQHVVADAGRRARSRRTLPLEAAGQIIDPDNSSQDTDIMVRAALRTLPDDERTTIELQLAGWTSEQIAAALGRRPSTVRMARLRAINTLRSILSGAEPGAGTEPRRGALPC
jgi:RNA polymerase sigma-70 factor (ECF subfamily)